MSFLLYRLTVLRTKVYGTMLLGAVVVVYIEGWGEHHALTATRPHEKTAKVPVWSMLSEAFCRYVLGRTGSGIQRDRRYSQSVYRFELCREPCAPLASLQILYL